MNGHGPPPAPPGPPEPPSYRLPGTLADLVLRPRRGLATLCRDAPVLPTVILTAVLTVLLALGLLGSRLIPRPGQAGDGVLATSTSAGQAVVALLAILLIPAYLALLAALTAAVARRLGGRRERFRPAYAVIGHAALVLAPLAGILPLAGLLGESAAAWVLLGSSLGLAGWSGTLTVLGLARACAVDWVLALIALAAGQAMLTSLLCCCIVVLSGLAGS